MAEKKQGKRGKRPPSKVGQRLRNDLAANLQALLDRDFPPETYPKKSERQRAASRAAGVSWSSIQRLLDSKIGKNIDTVADVAAAFHISASDLLRADFKKNMSIAKRLKPPSGGNDELQRGSG